MEHDNIRTMGRVEYLPLGLKVQGDLTFEQWQQTGQTLRDMRDNSFWWLGDWWLHGERVYGDMASQAAKEEVEVETGYKYQTVVTAAWVATQYAYEERVEGVSWTHHRVAAAIEDKGVRQELLHEALKEKWTVAQMEEHARPYKKKEPPRKRTAGLFDGDRFNFILADPPWKYEDNTTTPNRRIENQYPTMELHAICNLRDDNGKPLTDLIHDNATLALWTTAPKVAEAMKVIEAWGFDYRTQMVWDKGKIGPGHYVRGKHEILLFAVKGKPGTPKPADRPPSCGTIEEYERWMYGAKKAAALAKKRKKLRHSEKPDVFYAILERMYPKATRLELFARGLREGWGAWGLDVPHVEEKKSA